MNKMDMLILAVSASDIQDQLTKSLEKGDYIPFESSDEYDQLVKNGKFLRRGDLEEDPNFKQIIPYTILKSGDKILYYSRTDKGNEARLYNKFSVGVGGHVDKEDETQKQTETIDIAMRRELDEEFGIKDDSVTFLPLGYIYTEISDVDKVHIGILMLAVVDENAQVKTSDEIAKFEFVSKDKLLEMLNNPENDPENWTRITLTKAIEQIFAN